MTSTIQKIKENRNESLKTKLNQTSLTKPSDSRSIEDDCFEHMFNNGFTNPPPNLVLDGETVKFSGRGNSDKSEWYKGSENVDGSIIVTYNSHHDTLKSCNNHVFISKAKKLEHEKELEARNKRVTKIINERQKEENKKKERAEKKSKRDQIRFNNALTIGQSKYLTRKKVGAHGIRFEKEAILIPMRDENGEIQALQEIYDEKKVFGENKKPRDKNFTNLVKGLFHVIGKIIDGYPIRVSEGYATAASCYESTGYEIPHVVAFTASAYNYIIPILRNKYPNSPIIICADNNIQDNPEKENVGVKKAEKAASENSNCSVVYPKFYEGREKDQEGKRYADFNDLMRVEGDEEVRRQIENIQTNISQEDSKLLVEDSACLIDEQQNIEFSSNEMQKATANARRGALKNQETYDEIVKKIRKQHPSLKGQAEDIAKKALSWAKKFQNGCEVVFDGIPKRITDMKSLNSRLALLESSGTPCITINRKDGLPLTDADYKKRLSGEVVVSDVNEKGQPKYIPAYKFWEGSTHKHIYNNIVFTNKQTYESDYNLFAGFGINPESGECSKILEHIKEVICSGDDTKNKAILNLLAWQIQNIGKPSRIIVLLQSNEQQIGKGCFCNDILAPIFGNSGFATNDIGQITGRFNDSIRGKAYIFLDECLFSGDKKVADSIKSLSTATRISIESKGVPIVQIPCGINLYIATNHDDAAHIEEADARYWVLPVSPHRKGDINYFEALYSEINGRGLSAFLYYLLNLDITKFVPQRDVPINNEAKNKMIENSINPYDARKWLEECCENEMIMGMAPSIKTSSCAYEPWVKGEEYKNEVFALAYKNWQQNIKSPVAPKPTKSNIFGAILNDAQLNVRIINRVRMRTLPDPEECLKKVKELLKSNSKK